MNNLLIILGVLFLTLAVILPLVQRFAKPVEPDMAQNYQKIFAVLMAAMVIALIARLLMDR